MPRARTAAPAPSLTRPRHRRQGDYPTSSDVADYLARNTIIPFLLNEISRARPRALRVHLHRAGASRIPDLVTRNLDLVGLLLDLLRQTSDEEFVRTLWLALTRISVLDPTCGEGALLIAAGRLLRTLFKACIARVPSLDAPIEEVIRRALHGVEVRPAAIRRCRKLCDNVHAGNALTRFDWHKSFPQIMERGGFDIILGNPPFLELNEVNYAVSSFDTASCGAVHGLCVERSLDLLQPNGWFGMVLPMAVASTQRMKCVQDLLEDGRSVWYSHYAWRPARLFPDVNRAITLVLAARDDSPATFTTGYRKWRSEDRAQLLPSLQYAEAPRDRSYFWAPKIGCTLERRLLERLLALPTRARNFMADDSNTDAARVYYRCDGGLYWKVFTDFPPAFSQNGINGHSTREVSFALKNPSHLHAMIAVLSSDLFWWWYTVSSNCRHLNPSDVQQFPLPASALEDEALRRLAAEYLQDIVCNSTMRTRQQRQTGRTQTQTFRIRKSRPILLRIDQALAPHYSLDASELNFVANFDVAFRMAGDAGSHEAIAARHSAKRRPHVASHLAR